MAVGLFGGEFDPVHATHVRIAGEAIRQARLERLLVVPNACPPHRGRPLAAVENRLEMLRIAMRLTHGVEVANLEPDGGTKPFYTVDTVERACLETGADHVALVVGADVMSRLDEWRRWRELAGMCGWLVVPRRGHDFESAAPATVLSEFGGRTVSPAEAARRPGSVAVLDFEPTADSSSSARETLRSSDGRPEMIPPEVLDYIRERRLYA